MPNYQLGKIYQIINDVNNIVYIGSTCQPLCSRMACHRSEGNVLRNKSPLYLAMHDIGVEHFRILLVENASCNSREELLATEYKVVLRFQQLGMPLYNAIMDARHSEETRAKMSQVQKGRVVSEATRAKLSEIGKSRIVSSETRAKMSKALCKRGCVSYDKNQDRWCFYWRESGKTVSKYFSVKKYGADGAHGLALFYQEEMYPIEREDDSEFIQEIKDR